MNEKKNKINLIDGAPLMIENLNVTMKVITFQGPRYYHGFFRKLWNTLTCHHDMSGKWFNVVYCKKCGRMI